MSATTPRKAHMSASHSPAKNPPRRVLGDLTPKALNTPSKHTTALDSSDAMRAQSPLKQVTTLSPRLFVAKENLASVDAYPHGKKRSFNEVESSEEVGNVKAMFGARDRSLEGSRLGLTAAAVQAHTEYNAVDLPVPGSPTERNTPTPSPPPEERPDMDDSQETQATQGSFSHLIDYTLCASQNCEQPPPPMEEEKKSRAEVLRARLGFGLYKVKTNQTTKRGSDIIASFEVSSEAANASMSTAITSSAESLGPQSVPLIEVSPVSPNPLPRFYTANLDAGRPCGPLTPAPFLPHPTVTSRATDDYDLSSSSPPQAPSPIKEEVNYQTPMSKRAKTGEDLEVGLDEKDDAVRGRLQRLQDKRFQEGDLTSSAVKGNAAKIIMDLMSDQR